MTKNEKSYLEELWQYTKSSLPSTTILKRETCEEEEEIKKESHDGLVLVQSVLCNCNYNYTV